MLLKELQAFRTLEEAAEGMAGNYLKWDHFVYFGQPKDPHKAKSFLLAYTVNHINGGGACEISNHEVLRKYLEMYIGEGEDALVNDFSSDFCGDKKMLEGFKIVVYKDGQITDAFRRAYFMSRKYKDGLPLSDKYFKIVCRREIMRDLNYELPHICEKLKLEFSTELIGHVTDVIMEDFSTEFEPELLGEDEYERALKDLSDKYKKSLV